MLSIKNLFFFVFYLYISAVLAVNPKSVKENEESRKLKAESADRHIRFITPAEFSAHISDGLWIIMYGANWCKYTQRLTPKWLGLQTRIRSENLSHDINIAKVECTKDIDFCASQGVEGFPTIYIYENGKKYEEYLGNHEINEMFTYIQEQIARHKSDDVIEEIVTVYVDEEEYEAELERNKPKKSSNEEMKNYQNKNAPSKEEMMKGTAPKAPPVKKNVKNPPPEDKIRRNQQQQQQPPKRQQPPPKQQQHQPPKQQKQQPPKQQQQQYGRQQQNRQVPPKMNNNMPPKQPQYGRPLPPKKPNVVVRATKSVFGLMESLILLAVVLVVVYIIFRFKAIKNRSAYGKSKIPLYRDLTQEEKFMLHYS